MKIWSVNRNLSEFPFPKLNDLQSHDDFQIFRLQQRFVCIGALIAPPRRRARSRAPWRGGPMLSWIEGRATSTTPPDQKRR